MKIGIRYSNSLILIWHVAEFEARQLRASTIEPIHLLLGLCKTVDLDLLALIPNKSPNRDEVLEECLREVRRIRTVFREAELNAAQFRRRLRGISGAGRFGLAQPGCLHRNDAAKAICFDAERFAQLTKDVVYPINLLCAVLDAPDEQRDRVMEEFGILRLRLLKAARNELFSPACEALRVANQLHWN